MLARHAASPAHPMPDPIRITAGSAALLVNAAAALLLLLPQQFSQLPLPTHAIDPPTHVVLIPQTLIPAPPVPAPPAPVKPLHRAVAAPQPIPAPLPTPLAPTPVEVAITAPSVAELAIEASGAASTEPASGTRMASIDYAFAPPPPYPAIALRRGVEGTVWLRIEVDESGTPVRVSVERSSGDHALDAGARVHVLKHWRFQPARLDGQAIRGIALVPVVFRLNGG